MILELHLDVIITLYSQSCSQVQQLCKKWNLFACLPPLQSSTFIVNNADKDWFYQIKVFA